MTGMFDTCPKCGGARPVGASFCSRCGQPLDGVDASPPRWRRPIRVRTAVLVALGVLVLIGVTYGGVSALGSSSRDEADTSRAVASEQSTTTTAEPAVQLRQAADAYWKMVTGTLQEWDDLTAVASSTPRINLSGVIVQLQDAKRRASGLSVSGKPEDIQTVHRYLVLYMDSVINAYRYFMGDFDDSLVNSQFDSAEDYLFKFTTALSSLRETGLMPSAATLHTTTTIPLGDSERPIPVGQVAQVGDWEVKVTDSSDATQAIAEEHGASEAPEDGCQYVVVKIEATYTGEKGSDGFLRDFGMIHFTGNEGGLDRAHYVLNDSLPDGHGVSAGESVSVSIVFEVESDQVSGAYVTMINTSDNDGIACFAID